MRISVLAAVFWSILLLPNSLAEAADADLPPIEKGTVQFKPSGDQKNIPKRYRLKAHGFAYQMEQIEDLPLSGLTIHRLTFPSPVTSDCKENNTVHAEYYRPRGKGPFPCVIVLDITAGDQSLSRFIATNLAQNNIGGLFVQMAYYGPRRPAGSKLRLLSHDFKRTTEGIRQTVLDLRRATAWMESRPEIDAKRLGIMGTSLGSFVSALTGEMEPKLRRVAVLLGGGGFVDAYWDDPRAKSFRKVWQALGGTKESAARLVAPVDPITCAANLKDRRLLILAAKRDNIVPPRMAEALWKATGKQKIVWYDCTHYGAALYLLSGLQHVVKHFGSK
jgi:dienelactone hydrolase